MTEPTKTQTLAIENRPKVWGEVVGQEIPVRILTSSIAMRDIKPGYLFDGKSGSGKTTAATLLAKTLVCESPVGTDPCNTCKWCSQVDRQVCSDVKYVDGASERSVAYVRETLVPFLTAAPLSGRARVAIIDEAHLYKVDAISAFLTLLEQLPQRAPKSVVILCTTEGDDMDPAIRNRCMALNFKPIASELVAEVMFKHTGANPEVLELLARECNGSFRLVWSFIESWQYLGEELTEELMMRMMGGVTRAERNRLWTELSANQMDKVATRWKKWISGGASPKVVGNHLTRDAIEFASKAPEAGNWVKVFSLLSGAQILGTEVAWLPALYTMAGLPLSVQVGATKPDREQPHQTFVSHTGSVDPHIERLAFFG